ncbi:MAG: FMN-binding protein [Gammaproteobacteria bacterium]|nr:FMN-binding protein [Gammaproteobacteria bacterium]
MKALAALFLLMLSFPSFSNEEVYLSPDKFIDKTFSEEPEQHYFWLTKPHKSKVSSILGRKPNQIRIKYWGKGVRTAWILDEIGKEQPITVGITVEEDKIKGLHVLIYRESRGYEVKQSFFTEQYIGATLDKKLDLTQNIDGITGATLSVRALNKLARVALYLHKQSPFSRHEQTAALDKS